MLCIDGADGGGQVLRTALSLAAITDTPFRIENVRGSRPEPGLRPQHVAAVETVAHLCDAEVAGVELGADSLTFRPGDGRRTAVRADVGTAGSVTLLFDAALPVTVAAGEPLEMVATGGTDVKWAPTVEYYRRVKLSLLARFGLVADLTVERTGFYPAGGGEATLATEPTPLSPVVLDERGSLERVEIHSRASETLEERDVAERQATHAAEALEGADLPAAVAGVEYVPTRSPGSALLLCGVYEHTLTGVDALGERGRSSEEVAEGAVEEFAASHATGAPVDDHLADQVMVFLALAGGTVRVPEATAHVRTNLDVLDAFGSDVRLTERADGALVLEASASPWRD